MSQSIEYDVTLSSDEIHELINSIVDTLEWKHGNGVEHLLSALAKLNAQETKIIERAVSRLQQELR